MVRKQYGSKVITDLWIYHHILERGRWWLWRTTGSTKWIANPRSTQRANNLNGQMMPVILILTRPLSNDPRPKMIMTAAESMNSSMRLLT